VLDEEVLGFIAWDFEAWNRRMRIRHCYWRAC